MKQLTKDNIRNLYHVEILFALLYLACCINEVWLWTDKLFSTIVYCFFIAGIISVVWEYAMNKYFGSPISKLDIALGTGAGILGGIIAYYLRYINWLCIVSVSLAIALFVSEMIRIYKILNSNNSKNYNMKNWKTTLFGIGAGLCLLGFKFFTGVPITADDVITALGLAGLGFAAKDYNVTGR